MKKILICNYKGDVVSGAEKAIVDMILPIKEDFNFTMFVPSEGKLSKFYKSNGLKVIVKKLSNKRKKYPGLHFIQSMIMSQYIKNEKFDLIVSNTFYAAEKIATASKLSQVPLVIYVREYFDLNNPSYKRNLKIAKKIFAVSEDVKNSLNAVHSNIDITHDYLNIDLINKSNLNLKLDISSNFSKSKKVVLIGRITPYKQQDLFIDSYFLVSKFFPNVEYYIIGEAAYNEKYFENSLKKKCENFNNIHFLGNRNDIYKLLPNFDISCMVSDREPFPRTILESQYLKVPVIASNTGGALEMIKNDITGVFFNVKNKSSKELSDKIIYLLKNESLCNNIKENAFKELLKTYASEIPIQNFKQSLINTIKEFS